MSGIKNVNGWQTTDGKFFSSFTEAIEHQDTLKTDKENILEVLELAKEISVTGLVVDFSSLKATMLNVNLAIPMDCWKIYERLRDIEK